ncbi:MAG: NAD(P)/FAD-dependent oxidoreductase [Anaerosomatales bacterium]|nr:NAD(P)/FAD-dependent oxidoreductase [Anaerosomatales bacterium]
MDAGLNTGCATEGAGRRVVIAGGGYAGTTLAVKLAKAMRPDDDLEIMLIEPNPCQQALSELDLVAVGPPRPEFCELWHPTVFKDLPVTVCYDRVDDVRAKEHVVLVGPRDGEKREVGYWRLVIATGAIAFVPPVPGLAEHAVTMWSVADAQELQRRIEAQFRIAARLPDAASRRRALTFVVVGGGATGIEIVGTLGQMLPKRMRSFGLDPADLRVVLVEGRPDILYDLPQSLREKAKRRLARLSVELRLGSMVSAVEDGLLKLADGSVIDAPVLVFCGGAKADPDAIGWGLEADPSGRLVSGPDLKVPGHDDVYAVGDVAAFRDPADNRTLPMLAQFAIREAEHLAESILREARGEPPEPFHPHMHGEFVSIGPSWGVGWALRWHLTGLPAIVMKRLTYALYWWIVGGIPLAWRRTREMLAMQR